MYRNKKRGLPKQPSSQAVKREHKGGSRAKGSTSIELFIETLGLHPEFFKSWKPSDLGVEPPF